MNFCNFWKIWKAVPVYFPAGWRGRDDERERSKIPQPLQSGKGPLGCHISTALGVTSHRTIASDVQISCYPAGDLDQAAAGEHDEGESRGEGAAWHEQGGERASGQDQRRGAQAATSPWAPLVSLVSIEESLRKY